MEDTTNFSLDRKNAAIVAVGIVLIIAAVVITYSFWAEITGQPANTGYHTIYLLDTNGQASNYPEVLVANKNSTFNINVGVENHKKTDQDYQVRVIITQNALTFPVNGPTYNSYEIADLPKDGIWSEQATVTINEAGNYAVVFELWAREAGSTSDYLFTDNSCILNIQVIPK